MDANKPLGLVVTTGGWATKDRPSADARMPLLYVAHNHYEMLYRLASRPAPARTRLELNVENRFIPGPIKVANTIGEIRGSEKPEEFVVVGAHLDSWDLGSGTADNGTGSSVVLETARILAKCGTKPKRTIRFILFTGEEQGLHGSRAYVTQHKDEMARTSAALVHDTGTGKVRGVGCGGKPEVQSLLQRELVSLRRLGVTDFTSRSPGGSDHQSFGRGGVHGFCMVQDPAGYPLAHHTQADTLDFARGPELIQGAQVIAVTAMRIANLPALLPRATGKR
jgi:Zn-dependent M28 family amino/carboxypeptidase